MSYAYASRGMTGGSSAYPSGGILSASAETEFVLEFPKLLIPLLVAASVVRQPRIAVDSKERPDPTSDVQISAAVPSVVPTISVSPKPGESIIVKSPVPSVSSAAPSSGPVPSVTIKKK